jgi:hypothetical protein
MADLRSPVVGAHDYVPRPRARWIASSTGFRGYTRPLCVSHPLVRAAEAAASTIPASCPEPWMEPLARRQLGPAVAGQLFQLHGAPPASYLSLGLGGGLQHDAPHYSISW